MIDLRHGDCLDVMRTLDADSIDACVCDPPYGISFMGRKWDSPDNVAFRAETWVEVLRVLKPGAHLVAFSGTRTYHRMVCAIEDAGFEVRDQMAWVYGCLSEDTEILTADGWKLGTAVDVGERVAAWDPDTGVITLEPIQEMFRAPWAGELVRFVNDDTDQMLTPNHRVYHRPSKRRMTAGIRSRWYEEQWECSEASAISRWNSIKLPAAGLHDGPGIGGNDYASLLGWVWTEGGFDKSGSGVRIYQSSSANPAKSAEIDALISSVVPTHKRYDRERTYTYGNTARKYKEVCWYFSGEVAEQVRRDLPEKHPSWSLLWRMTLAEKRSFWAAAMKGDGCGYDFYQNDLPDLQWSQALLSTMGFRGKISMRAAPRTGGYLCATLRDSTELQARHLRQASARYDGDVWCVRVSTGAFVARRNGKVFITGNSGFPKSHDISKAIDKAAGAEREVIGRYGKGFRAAGSGLDGWQRASHAADKGITAPATDAAKQWQGWGTALKPSWEPIIACSKPVTVAQHFAMIIREITLMVIEAARCSGANADDVAGSFSDIQAKLSEVGDSSVLDGARMRSLESIGIAPYAALSSTFRGLVSLDRLKTKDCSVLSHVRPSLSVKQASEPTTLRGMAGDLLSRLMATSTSVMVDGMSANIVSSWRSISEDLLAAASTFTIGTASKLTIALKTLSLSMSPSITGDTGGLSPNWEPIVLARKPLSERTIAANVLRHGCGGLNIDACRVACDPGDKGEWPITKRRHEDKTYTLQPVATDDTKGRWPANIAHDGSDEVLAEFAKYGESKSSGGINAGELSGEVYGKYNPKVRANAGGLGDCGTPARFFFSAKADADDRLKSKHPTVKPVNLMRWLVRMVTPTGGTVLDPFAGSGTTGMACMAEGFNAVLIEREEEYVADIRRRIAHVKGGDTPLFAAVGDHDNDAQLFAAVDAQA